MNFAEKLITLRRRAGLSQEQLAERLKVSRQAVSKWETAETLPETMKVVQLSRLFKVTTDYLLKDEQEEETPASGESPASPEPPAQPAKKNRGRVIAGWILTGLGSLGYLMILVLSTMIQSWEPYSYHDNAGKIWYSQKEGYTLSGFIEKYRLEALLWVLGGLTAAGLVLLLWEKWKKWENVNINSLKP